MRRFRPGTRAFRPGMGRFRAGCGASSSGRRGFRGGTCGCRRFWRVVASQRRAGITECWDGVGGTRRRSRLGLGGQEVYRRWRVECCSRARALPIRACLTSAALISPVGENHSARRRALHLPQAPRALPAGSHRQVGWVATVRARRLFSRERVINPFCRRKASRPWPARPVPARRARGSAPRWILCCARSARRRCP